MPVEVIGLYFEDGSHSEWVAKGAHSLEEMIDGVKYEMGDDFFEKGEDWGIVRCHMRCVPAGKYSDYSPGTMFYYQSRPGRGAFEATVLTTEYK